MSQLSEAWKKYKKKDFNRLSWNDYYATVDILKRKIQNYIKKNKIVIDAVVPVLRGGVFPGAHLAYRLGILKIIPVQSNISILAKRRN